MVKVVSGSFQRTIVSAIREIQAKGTSAFSAASVNGAA